MPGGLEGTTGPTVYRAQGTHGRNSAVHEPVEARSHQHTPAMEATHRGCLSLLAQERPAAAHGIRLLQQGRIRRGGDSHAGRVHNDGTAALDSKQRSPEEKHVWAEDSRAKRAGKHSTGAQARAHYLHNLRRGKARQGGTEGTQNDLQRKEERSHGQAAKGGERGNTRQKQWKQGLFSYCGDRFKDQNRDDREQQRWM